MNLLEHTIHWVKGEIFEGSIIIVSGVLAFIVGFMLWQFGTTPGSKTLVIPTFVVGILFVAMGVSMIYSNNKRLPEMEAAYNQNPAEFAKTEKQRVEDFQILYPISLAVSAVCFALTLLFFWFTKNETLYATGIALSVFGIALIVIDYFSKERASIYYEQILQNLQ
jgi:membrane-bound ClpP family serine protease